MPLLDQPTTRTPLSFGFRRRVRVMRTRRGFESRCVWILGSPRTGSSWLLQLLRGHHAVIPVNEPLIGWYLGPFLSDTPGWSPNALDSGNFTMRRVNAAKRDHFFSTEFADQWTKGLRDLITKRYAAQVATHRSQLSPSQTRVVIQEPNGSQSADVIMASFPRARLLFLLRDGRDVVDSDLAAHEVGSWLSKQFPGATGINSNGQRRSFIIHSAHKWLWRTQVVQEAFAAHEGPKMLVRYEDLRHDTETQLRAILGWMDLEIGDAQLKELVERHTFEALPEEDRGRKSFFRAATPGLWRESFSESEQADLTAVIGPKLRELGYE